MSNKKIEDEINFKNVIKSPIRLFGLIYPYILIMILGLGVFYVKSIDTISFNHVPANLSDSLKIDVKVDLKKGGIMPAVDLSLVSKPTDEMISKGKQLFDSNCQSCHGAQGNGDGPGGAALNPKPRNFHVKEGWTNGREFSEMFKTLQEGIVKKGMAAYEYLPVTDRFALIHYIRSLDSFPEITDKEISQLDVNYNLSKGVVSPNEIPVEAAITKIVNERGISDSTIQLLLDKIDKSTDTRSVQLFNNFVLNKKKVLANISVNVRNLQNSDEYVKKIMISPYELGFKPGIRTLEKGEIQNLIEFLTKNII